MKHYDALLREIEVGDYVATAKWSGKFELSEVLYTTPKMVKVRNLFKSSEDKGTLVYGYSLLKIPKGDVTVFLLKKGEED